MSGNVSPNLSGELKYGQIYIRNFNMLVVEY